MRCVAFVSCCCLQKHVSAMHLLSPAFDPSRDYQAISRVHRDGQVAGEVRIVTWVQLGMHENRYLHQVLKSQKYGVYQQDVRLLLGLPVVDSTVAGAAEDTAVLPADDAAISHSLDELQGGTEAQRTDWDQSDDEESDDDAYDMP